jgi:hypothetical protein
VAAIPSSHPRDTPYIGFCLVGCGRRPIRTKCFSWIDISPGHGRIRSAGSRWSSHVTGPVIGFAPSRRFIRLPGQPGTVLTFFGRAHYAKSLIASSPCSAVATAQPRGPA